MNTASIHRLIEQHAARRGDLVAVVDGDRSLSYRELNYAANALARTLMARGFRRGARAAVCLPRGVDLAVALLAVLKAGGCYTWREPNHAAMPHGISFPVAASGTEERHLHFSLAEVCAGPIVCTPNLPVLTRDFDTACVVESDGLPLLVVPHATVVALRTQAVPHPTPWSDDPSALDLWMALMAGTTAIVEYAAASAAAA